MSYETILFEKSGSTGILRLNRPERMNAVSEEMYSEIIDLLNTISNDKDIRVLILTGSVRIKDGKEKQAFCAGADLKKHSSGERTHFQKREYINLAHRATLMINRFPRPVIAAVNGPARGAGAEMAVNCDFILMADEASIAFPEISLGTFVGGGVTKILPEIIGIKKTRELIYTGRVLNGIEAVDFGLANASYSIEELMLKADELASTLTSLAPISLSLAKKHLRLSTDRDIESVLDAETESILTCMDTEDWKEGIDAFSSKRQPMYRGQ